MASELSNQVYTAPQAPDYLGHYAELVRNIPDYGKQFAQAQIQAAQLERANAEYEIMKQKAKSFTELYPAWKAAQIAKLAAETSTFPYKQALLQEQAGLAKARAGMYTGTGANAPGDPLASITRANRPGSKPGTSGSPIDPWKPIPGLPNSPYPTAPVTAPPLATAPIESDTPPTAITTPSNPDEEYYAGR